MGGGAGQPAWCRCLTSAVARRFVAACGGVLGESPDAFGVAPLSLRRAALATSRAEDNALLWCNSFLTRNMGRGAARPQYILGEVARDKGAKVDAVNNDGQTPLHRAALSTPPQDSRVPQAPTHPHCGGGGVLSAPHSARAGLLDCVAQNGHTQIVEILRGAGAS